MTLGWQIGKNNSLLLSFNTQIAEKELLKKAAIELRRIWEQTGMELRGSLEEAGIELRENYKFLVL